MPHIITSLMGGANAQSFGPFESRQEAVALLQNNGWNTPDQYDHFWVFGEIPPELRRKKMYPFGCTTAVIKEIPEVRPINEFARLCRNARAAISKSETEVAV